MTDRDLARRDLQVRWIGRGRGCVFHGPGQLAKRGRPITMTKVRFIVVEKISAALDQPGYHLSTGHPYLSKPDRWLRAPSA